MLYKIIFTMTYVVPSETNVLNTCKVSKLQQTVTLYFTNV